MIIEFKALYFIMVSYLFISILDKMINETWIDVIFVDILRKLI